MFAWCAPAWGRCDRARPRAGCARIQRSSWWWRGSAGEWTRTSQWVTWSSPRRCVAWALRPGGHAWELIDEGGRLLIDPGAGYLDVAGFADGRAWVSRDGTNEWIAIDRSNTVLISAGFDDVRPFRRGIAVARRGGLWGAVDAEGRVVVAFRYDGFSTALHDGRYIDGFCDSGLAVVSLDGHKGVVDRTGALIVPPVYSTIVVHPVAFLYSDGTRRWGALDRRGRPLLEPEYPSRITLTDELDRLLTDARPIL